MDASISKSHRMISLQVMKEMMKRMNKKMKRMNKKMKRRER